MLLDIILLLIVIIIVKAIFNKRGFSVGDVLIIIIAVAVIAHFGEINHSISHFLKELTT